MSDMDNKKNISDKYNEIVSVNTSEAKEVISENIWIIGVSKTHPGLKYYFNTVTGVSLWNISREDLERAKQTMKSHHNQSLYINCPEPKDPPPVNRMANNKCIKCKKQSQNSGLDRNIAGFTCDVCFNTMNSPPNLITLNIRSSTYPASTTQNAFSTQSQIQSTSSFLDSPIIENTSCNKGLHQLLQSQKFQNRVIPETADQASSNEHNKSNNEESHNHATGSFETLDLTPLKMFAKNGQIKDKWYIIADADVYLQHIKLLKSVVNSDSQCCLMVPQNVKFGLENAKKSDLRTKAHYATYFIYKMFDMGLAVIEEESSTCIEDKTNEEHILESCSKLRENNFYVVVISNDIDLQKYRNKIYIPIFTVSELKEYLYKRDNSEAARSPETRLNMSQMSKNYQVITQNNPCSKSLDTNESIINAEKLVERNRAPVKCNNMGTQVEVSGVISQTVDAEIQTEIHSIQMGKSENSYDTNRPDENINRGMNISTSNKSLCQSSLHNSNSGTIKRIKLRRRKTFNETSPNLSAKVIDQSESISNNLSLMPSNNSLLLNKNLEDQIDSIDKCLMHNQVTKSNTRVPQIEENIQTPKKPLKSVQSINHESKSCTEDIENKNVMFDVTSDTMDDNLRTRCDEWVSRFSQIMEEALIQVLRKNSSLHLPPPLNMYEAAICVQTKFDTDEDVKDASKKFLNILNSVCDKKGNINANISPLQYMEMYSFGVYVIDALQGIFSKCEDLQSAAESLSKLLNDIQDPQTDITNIEHSNNDPDSNGNVEHSNNEPDNNGNVEVFMIVETESNSDENQVGAESPSRVSEEIPRNNFLSGSTSGVSEKKDQLKITFSNSDYFNNYNANVGHDSKNSTLRTIQYVERNDESQEDDKNTDTETQNVRNTPETSPSRYNLISQRVTTPSKITNTESLANATNIMRDNNLENSFFSNLLLQKNVCNESLYNDEERITEDIHHNVEFSDYTASDIERPQQFNSRLPDISTAIANEPKVVRNFVVCSQFEDRLRARHIQNEMEEMDFEEGIMSLENLDEDISSGGTGRLEIDEFPEYHDSVDGYHMEPEITKSSEYVALDFKYFIRRIAEQIKDMSSEVYTFSKHSCDVLNSFSTAEEKNCIKTRAAKAHLYVDKICMALTKILNRDKNGGSNIQVLLQDAEFDNISVDEEQLEVYGGFITRCLEHAHDLKNTLEDVLTAVCSF